MRRANGQMVAARRPVIRYRTPTAGGPPPAGAIVMGTGARVRRGYRVIRAAASKNGIAMLGFQTWRLAVEPMSAEQARAEIAAGAPHWEIVWDRRG